MESDRAMVKKTRSNTKMYCSSVTKLYCFQIAFQVHDLKTPKTPSPTADTPLILPRFVATGH